LSQRDQLYLNAQQRFSGYLDVKIRYTDSHNLEDKLNRMRYWRSQTGKRVMGTGGGIRFSQQEERDLRQAGIEFSTIEDFVGGGGGQQ
jgi:hypothetical protein